MRELKSALFCARNNFRLWRGNPVVLTLAVVILAFAFWNGFWIDQFCFAANMRVAPWIAPFLLNLPVMIVVYGLFSLLLFSDAPFVNGHTPFVMIRSGKSAWIKGQLLYIFAASLALSLFMVVSTLLVLLPVLGWSNDWGTVIRLLANYPSEADKYGIEASGIGFSQAIVNAVPPLGVNLLSILLMWLVSAFTGVLVLAFNVVVKHGSGAVAVGVLLFTSCFSIFTGPMFVGPKTSYLAPYTWVSLTYLTPFDVTGQLSVFYAIGALCVAIIALSIVSVLVFCRRDAELQRGAQ